MNFSTLISRTLLINALAVIAFLSLITYHEISVTVHDEALVVLLGFVIFHNFFNYYWLKKSFNQQSTKRAKIFGIVNAIVLALFFLGLSSVSPLFTILHGELEHHHVEMISFIHHAFIYCFFAFIIGHISALYIMIKRELK